MKPYEMITIVGPTASGKTRLATVLASQIGGEVISADSRQVYRGMDIGTGKDLTDYLVDGYSVPHHLIDIRQAGEKYNLFEYQHDFHRAYADILERGGRPILCGGTGMYVEAVLKGYHLPDVPENHELRHRLKEKTLAELAQLLASYGALHNQTDIDTAQRAIRAIEIAEFRQSHPAESTEYPSIRSLVVGINIDREMRRKRISDRLKQRWHEGMSHEVETLISSGVSPADLMYYGLEYKFVTQYVLGELTKHEMLNCLEIAIHQFAKRQMTWFRGMERRGIPIRWLDFETPLSEKIEQILAWSEQGDKEL